MIMGSAPQGPQPRVAATRPTLSFVQNRFRDATRSQRILAQVVKATRIVNSVVAKGVWSRVLRMPTATKGRYPHTDAPGRLKTQDSSTDC